jgi:hypothetical protein
VTPLLVVQEDNKVLRSQNKRLMESLATENRNSKFFNFLGMVILTPQQDQQNVGVLAPKLFVSDMDPTLKGPSHQISFVLQ